MSAFDDGYMFVQEVVAHGGTPLVDEFSNRLYWLPEHTRVSTKEAPEARGWPTSAQPDGDHKLKRGYVATGALRWIG